MSLSQPRATRRSGRSARSGCCSSRSARDEVRRDVDLGGGLGRSRTSPSVTPTAAAGVAMCPRLTRDSRRGARPCPVPRVGQEKRRMWTLRTRPMAMKAVRVLEPP